MAAQTQETTERFSVLRHHDPGKFPTHSIRLLASEFHYVYEDAPVLDLADDLRGDDSIQAVAVLDSEDAVVGAVIRKEIFARLSRPFAQDLYKKRLVKEAVASEVGQISGDENVFTVAEAISEQMKKQTTTFFLIVGVDRSFQGLFSTQDMLVYLSDITQADINLARKLQARIVRERDLVVGKSFEFASASLSAKGVGGDYYHVRSYADGQWVVSLCDVSGKGIAASIVTSVLWGMMSIYDFRRGLTRFLRELNSYIMTTFEAEKFITAVFLDYDERSGLMHICDLGHSHLFLYRDNRFGKLRNKNGNLPLGVVPDLRPGLSVFRPEDGDILLLLTDGLIEQRNAEGLEYSSSRVASVIRGNSDSPVETIADRLIADFEAFKGRLHLHDDMTFGIMKFATQEVIL
jgi:sigma-B regulation protein RsbU (phosphoserine phosphatase)